MQKKPTLLLVKDQLEEDQLVLNELSETCKSHFNMFHARQISEAQKIISEIISVDEKEQHRTEKALLEYREMLKIVIDNIPQYIFWKNNHFTYLGCNSRFVRALGLSTTEDIQGKTDQDLPLKGKGINTFQKLDRRVFATGKPELGLIVKQPEINGKHLWQRINKIPLHDVNGNITGVLSTFEDITKRMLAEERLKRTKKQAEDAMKLKDKFVSLVTHDLRSPLTNIIGFLKFLNITTSNNSNEKQNETFRLIHHSCENMLNMIDALLNISRLQTGELVPKPGFADAHFLCATTVENLKYIAFEKGIEIINKVPVGTRLYTDNNLFKEVLINLLTNALKFCNRGDQIELSAPSGRNTTIVVKDTGIGINAEILPDIFKHEEKTTTKGTAGEKGTGLGLPFCHDIMKAHGGSLTVESAEGKGTAFFAKLPYVKPLILLVDNNESIRLSLKKDLLKVNADFVEAQNGIDGIKFIKKKKPHLVITDIKMPVMNGLELLHYIKNNPKIKRTPAILVTSGKDMEVREMAVRMGADDFLTKPWKIHDLIPRVRRFIF